MNGQAAYETWRAAVPEIACNVPAGKWEDLPETVRAGFDAVAAQEPEAAGEPLTHFFHCWRFADHHACAVALIGRQQEENDRLLARGAPAQRSDAETAAMLRADLADAEAQLARWPRCPAGCSCRVGIEDDADRNECGCDGPCNGGEQPARGLAAYEADIASLTDQRNRVSDTADRLRAQAGRYRDLLDEVGTLAANADEDGDSFAVLEQIAMMVAAVDVPEET